MDRTLQYAEGGMPIVSDLFADLYANDILLESLAGALAIPSIPSGQEYTYGVYILSGVVWTSGNTATSEGIVSLDGALYRLQAVSGIQNGKFWVKPVDGRETELVYADNVRKTYRTERGLSVQTNQNADLLAYYEISTATPRWNTDNLQTAAYNARTAKEKAEGLITREFTDKTLQALKEGGTIKTAIDTAASEAKQLAQQLHSSTRVRLENQFAWSGANNSGSRIKDWNESGQLKGMIQTLINQAVCQATPKGVIIPTTISPDDFSLWPAGYLPCTAGYTYYFGLMFHETALAAPGYPWVKATKELAGLTDAQTVSLVGQIKPLAQPAGATVNGVFIPDLRDAYLMGSQTADVQSATGGSKSLTLTTQNLPSGLKVAIPQINYRDTIAVNENNGADPYMKNKYGTGNYDKTETVKASNSVLAQTWGPGSKQIHEYSVTRAIKGTDASVTDRYNTTPISKAIEFEINPKHVSVLYFIKIV